MLNPFTEVLISAECKFTYFGDTAKTSTFNGKPIHLSDYDMLNDGIRVRGHSVMMGYLDEEINKVAFENGGLKGSF